MIVSALAVDANALLGGFGVGLGVALGSLIAAVPVLLWRRVAGV